MSDPLGLGEVHSITNVLFDHLGGHRARLTFRARFPAALLQRTATDLWDRAVALNGSVKDASNNRRIQRFSPGMTSIFSSLIACTPIGAGSPAASTVFSAVSGWACSASCRR